MSQSLGTIAVDVAKSVFEVAVSTVTAVTVPSRLDQLEVRE